jgi:hypothetical protein
MTVLAGCGSSSPAASSDSTTPKTAGSQAKWRDDVVNGLVSDRTATREQAECIADGMVHAGLALSLDDLDISAAQNEQMMAVTLKCVAGEDLSDCVTESIVDILGPERLKSAGAFVRA